MDYMNLDQMWKGPAKQPARPSPLKPPAPQQKKTAPKKTAPPPTRMSQPNLLRFDNVARQDNTYVAPLESRMAARNRTTWDSIKEVGQLTAAVGQELPKLTDKIADQAKMPAWVKAANPLVGYAPEMLSGLGRSVGGTIEAVGCLPLLAEHTVKHPLKTGKAVVESIPHLADDYVKTAKERGPVAALTQVTADFFTGGAVKKALGLGKPVTKNVAKQVITRPMKKAAGRIARKEVQNMGKRNAHKLIRQVFPEFTPQQLEKMAVKNQKSLAARALKRATLENLRQMPEGAVKKLTPKSLGELVQKTARPAVKKAAHHAQHGAVHKAAHHTVHFVGEEILKHAAKHAGREKH